MKIDGNSIIKYGAIYGALVVLAGGVWAFGEKTGLRPWLKFEQDAFTNREFRLVMDSVDTLLKANAASRFIRTEERLKSGKKLSWEEKRDFCTDAQTLNYPVEGSYGLTCTRDGQPDLTVPAN